MRILAALLLLLSLSAFGANDEGTRSFDNYQVHYTLFPSTFLTPEIAAQHKITRSGAEALINVSVLKREPDGRSVPVVAKVTGEQYDLIRREAIPFREIREPGAIYYIGNFTITDKTTIYFTLWVEAEPGVPPQKIQFSKMLYREE
jgi:hypothetical protein